MKNGIQQSFRRNDIIADLKLTKQMNTKHNIHHVNQVIN